MNMLRDARMADLVKLRCSVDPCHQRPENPIDIDALVAEREMLWGEEYDEYLKLRAKQPHGRHCQRKTLNS
jgi:hypothetical protein